jgi:hypothetical protein
MSEGQSLYEQGCVLRRNRKYQEAYTCFEQSALLGFGRACWELAMVYFTGGLYKLRHAKRYTEFMQLGVQHGYLPCKVLWAVQYNASYTVISLEPEIKKCPLSYLLFNAHIPDKRNRLLDYIPTGSDPWVYCMYYELYNSIVGGKTHATRPTEVTRFLEYPAQEGIASAHFRLWENSVQFSRLKEAAIQLHGSACTTMCLNATFYGLAPRDFVHYLGGTPHPETVGLLLDRNGNVVPKDNDEWWHEAIVRAAQNPRIMANERSGFCKRKSEECRKHCIKAVVMWIMCSPFSSKDLTRLIGTYLLKKSWWWWKD